MAIGRISGPMLFSNLERQGVDLAFESNLLYIDVNNLRIGVINSSPQYSLDSSGNVKLANIIIEGNVITSNTGKINFGSLSNIVISGGSTNQVLYTDGSGNLNWGQISELDVSWGNLLLTNNTISIGNTNGNLILAANGTGSVTTTNNFYAGNVYASNLTGNIQSNGGVFTGNISAPWFSGNVIATIINSVDGNIITLQSNNFSSGNILINGGVLTNINVQANNFSTANALISGGVIYNVNLQANNFSTANALVSGGVLNNVNIQANNINTGNAVISGGYISALTNAYITTSEITNFSTGNALISGGVFYNVNVQANNFSTANALITGGVLNNVDIQSNNFSTANALITSGNVTANITGNTTGTFGSFSGNLDSSWLVGNVNGSVGNFENVSVSTNLAVSGNLIATGNIIAQKLTSPTGDLHLSAATNDPNNIIRFDSVSALDIAAGTTAQRPSNPDYGYVRYNIDLGSIEWWTGATWIQGAQTITSEIINPDGINSTYTLNQTTSENSILVNINGTVQQAGAGAYSVTGNQITFAEIPLVTDIIEIRYIASGVAVSSTNFENISSNVKPSANVTYDLGSSSYRWRDLWLSGNTIHLGAANISAAGTAIDLPPGSTISGSPIGAANYSNVDVAGYLVSYTGNISAGNIFLTTLANVTTPAANLEFDPDMMYLVGPSFSLSNNNTTVTALSTMAGQEPSLLGTLAIQDNEKKVFTTYIDAGPARSDYLGIGITRANINLSSYPGSTDGVSIGLYDDGVVYGENSYAGSLPFFGAGDTVDIAVDRVNDLLWIRVNGGDWNEDPGNDPATATGNAITLSTYYSNSDPLYPVYGPYYYGGNADQMSIVQTSPYALPSGFTMLEQSGNTSSTYSNVSIGNGNVIIDNRIVAGNVYSGAFFWANGTPFSSGGGSPGNYGNANVKTYLESLSNVNIGTESGMTTQGTYAVAVGLQAGQTLQGTNTVAVGVSAGQTSQGIDSVAVGPGAGNYTQGVSAVAMGHLAGFTSQGNSAIAVGQNAGYLSQGTKAVGIGYGAGYDHQGINSIAVGQNTGSNYQGNSSIAIGDTASNQYQGNLAISIGKSAGEQYQSNLAIAIGKEAGKDSQGIRSIAIGDQAGKTTQGNNAIAIGYQAGYLNQASNSIVISTQRLDANTSGFFVDPVRNVTSGNVLVYDTNNKEVLRSNVNIVGQTGTPSNTATPASWLQMQVAGATYYMPLYQ